jgi:Uma2 family endonuclease
VPLSEYLNTSYRPDREYVDGELLERNVGEWKHSRLQYKLGGWLSAHEERLGVAGATEQRVQVKSTRFRIPDIIVVAGKEPESGIITEPPFLCIEILSPDDRQTEMRDRVADYLQFGVPFVWVIDPVTKLATIYTQDGAREIRDGILTTQDPDITVNLNELE